MNRLFGLQGYFAEGEAATAEEIFVAKNASAEHIEESTNFAGPS